MCFFLQNIASYSFMSFIPHKCLYRPEHVIGRQPFVIYLWFIYPDTLTPWQHHTATGEQSPSSQSLPILNNKQSHCQCVTVSQCHSTAIILLLLIWAVEIACRYILRQSWCCRCQYLWWGSYVVRLGKGRGHFSMTCQYWTAWLWNSYWRSDKNLSS